MICCTLDALYDSRKLRTADQTNPIAAGEVAPLSRVVSGRHKNAAVR
jgi:hypothetical protein